MQQILATLAFSALAGHAAAQSDIALNVGHEQGCRQLFVPDCSGERTRIDLRVDRAAGYSIYGYEKFSESATHSVLDWNHAMLSGRVRLGAHASWHMAVKGERLTWQRGFYLTPTVTAEVGAYVGQLEGRAGYNASASAVQDALHVPLPANPWGVSSFTIPAHSFSHTESDMRSGSSPYGGLTQQLRLHVPLREGWQLALTQQAQVGVDKAYLRLQASTDFTQAPWQASIGFSAEKVYFDPIYEHIEQKSGEIADKANHRLAPLARRLANTPYAVPTLSGADVQKALDLTSPYAEVQRRMQLQVHANIGAAKVSVMHDRPLKRSPSAANFTSVMFSTKF